MTVENPANDFCYVVPFERFVYKHKGSWQVHTPVGLKAIRDYLLSRGLDKDSVNDIFKASAYRKIVTVENVPNAPSIFQEDDGSWHLNTWVEPRLSPTPGDWPRIQRLVSWLVADDPGGSEWLMNWLAFKIQNPAAMPLTAVLLCGTPGSGKNTLSRVIREMLGMDNTADLNREALESRFNARWVSGLFAYADDLFTNDNAKDLNEKMKVLIASSKVELEGKGANQREVHNRLAWLLSSNQVAPIVVEKEDRRYTIFNNFDIVPAEYKAAIKSCYDVGTPSGLDPSFEAEIRGFWDTLLAWPVDRTMVSTPYENEARANIVESNKHAHELFLEDVDANSIDFYLKDLMTFGDPSLLEKERWDFGEEGVSTDVIYKAYRVYCEAAGKKPLARNKFGGSLQKHRPAWPGPFQKRIPGTRARTNIYTVKRSQEALVEYHARAKDREKKEQALVKREMALVLGGEGQQLTPTGT